jgi:protein-S-isoprenylcysteine O-methyltransferase Ste14
MRGRNMNNVWMDIPGTLAALAVSAYWLGIGVMIVRVRRHTHRMAGVVPGQRLERLMWLAWLPLAAAWIALPWLALSRSDAWLGLPAFAHDSTYAAARWIGAIVAVAALAATIKCWARMGKDWRMAVTDEPDQALITDGFYGRIRHPIYAFSILLVIASVVGVPTAAMAACGACLVALWVGKAHNEERHMLRQHGEDYARYLRRTGRFLPRSR